MCLEQLLKCEKYKADLEYGFMDIPERCHDIWVDSSSGYNMDDFSQ